MDFTFDAYNEKRPKADALVIPFWKRKDKQVQIASTLKGDISNSLNAILASGDFKGEQGETLFIYRLEGREKRIIMLGLGLEEKLNPEGLRCAYGALTKSCFSKKISSLNVVLPHPVTLSHVLFQACVEGLLLANYSFKGWKEQKSNEQGTVLIDKVSWIGAPLKGSQIVEETLAISEGVYYARDLVNGNADEITPQYLSACARGLAKEYPALKTTILDKKQIEKENMGLLLAVNRGSSLDPAFIIMEYKGDPKSKDHTVVVGKGITYDTGGLNLKVANMENMKADMSGAAVCFGIIKALCAMNVKLNVTAVIPSTENAIDANSFKPGDVYKSYLGLTVEMLNSDAEGRLVLADALAYANAKLKPTRMIDFATLTGAIDIALGNEAIGLMSNNDGLADAFDQAGQETFERVWRLPLYPEYRDRLRSDIADIKSWNGRSASSCVAATFLKEFVGETPWVHFDIASTAFAQEARRYHPKYGTGIGVRLMMSYLLNK